MSARNSPHTNRILDLLIGTPAAAAAYNRWGGLTAIAMAGSVKFRITKSVVVDFVCITNCGAWKLFEVEFGACVGSEFQVIDRIRAVTPTSLISTISDRLSVNQ